MTEVSELRLPSAMKGFVCLFAWGVANLISFAVPPVAAIAYNIALAGAFFRVHALSPVRTGDLFEIDVLRLYPPPKLTARISIVVAAILFSIGLSALFAPLIPIDPFMKAYLARPYGRLSVEVSATLFAPLYEEFIFRGWFLRPLESKLGTWAAVAITSAGFAFIHVRLAGLPYFFVIGAVMAFLAIRTGSIWSAVLAHSACNIAVLITGR